MMTKVQLKRDWLSLCVQEEMHRKTDPICPLQQTHPSDEPDQGTRGTKGPDTRASSRKTNISIQEAQDTKKQSYFCAFIIWIYFLETGSENHPLCDARDSCMHLLQNKRKLNLPRRQGTESLR